MCRGSCFFGYTAVCSSCGTLFYRKRLPQQNGDMRKRDLHVFKLHVEQGQLLSPPSPRPLPPPHAIKGWRALCLLLPPSPPPPPTHSPWLKFVIFRVFSQKGGRPLFRGSKVMQLNSDSFCDYVRIWMAVIGHLWAELDFWFFLEKGWKYLRPQTFDRTQIFRQVVPVQEAGTVRQRRHPYKLSGSESRSHLRTAWRRGNTIWERALQPDWEGVRSWRFCRAQIVRVVDADICGRIHLLLAAKISTAALLLSYIMRHEHSWWGADILYMSRYLDRRKCHGRKHFIGANISWAQIFHGRKYFMGANISWAQIFHGRKYFMGANISWAQIFWGVHIFWLEANILCINYYFRQAPIFNDFCSKFCPVFAMSFCLI